MYNIQISDAVHEQCRMQYPQSDLESDKEHQQLTTEQQVEALQNLSPISQCDRVDTTEVLIAQFASEGCGCSRKCSAQFSINHLRDIRAQCYELSHDELDMVLLGQLKASCNDSDHT